MGTYRVKYKMKGQSWKETTIEASNGSEAQKNIKSMMGPNCENSSAGILITKQKILYENNKFYVTNVKFVLIYNIYQFYKNRKKNKFKLCTYFF